MPATLTPAGSALPADDALFDRRFDPDQVGVAALRLALQRPLRDRTAEEVVEDAADPLEGQELIEVEIGRGRRHAGSVLVRRLDARREIPDRLDPAVGTAHGRRLVL